MQNSGFFIPVESRSRQKKTIIIALLISFLFIHLPLLFVFSRLDSVSDRKITQKQQKKDIIMLNLQDTTIPNQVVDISKPAVEKIPNKPSAQSLYNSSVEHETVSGHFSKNNGGVKTQKQQNIKASQPQQQQQTTEKMQQTKNNLANSQNNQTTTNTKSNLQDQLKMLKDEKQQIDQKHYADLFKNSQTSKLPSLATAVSQPGGGNSDDFLPNYKIGDRTFLNTLANPNIGYFVELRRKFRFAFNPRPVLIRQLNMISRGEISVVWGVTVDSTGHIAGLTLIRSSGLPDYDNEARRTITVSAPFSSPPTGMLDKNQQLNMAWTFVVYL